MVSKRTESLHEKMRLRIEELEKQCAEFEKHTQVAREKEREGAIFINSVAAMLDVSQVSTSNADSSDDVRWMIRRGDLISKPDTYSFHGKILRAISQLQMDFAREDEGSQIEAEKASILHDMLAAALHDPMPALEAAMKIKFLDMLAAAKGDIGVLMDIAPSFGVYPARNVDAGRHFKRMDF